MLLPGLGWTRVRSVLEQKMTRTGNSLLRHMELLYPWSSCTFQVLSRATTETSLTEVTGVASSYPLLQQSSQMQQTKWFFHRITRTRFIGCLVTMPIRQSWSLMGSPLPWGWLLETCTEFGISAIFWTNRNRTMMGTHVVMFTLVTLIRYGFQCETI